MFEERRRSYIGKKHRTYIYNKQIKSIHHKYILSDHSMTILCSKICMMHHGKTEFLTTNRKIDTQWLAEQKKNTSTSIHWLCFSVPMETYWNMFVLTREYIMKTSYLHGKANNSGSLECFGKKKFALYLRNKPVKPCK